MDLPNLTIVDGLLAFVILLSVLRGFSHGGIKELVGVSGWVVSFAVAFIFGPSVRPLMPEIGLFGDYADSCLIASFLAFLSLFALTLICFSLIAPVFARTSSGSAFGSADRLIGIGFGVVRGAVILLGAYMLYDALVPDVDKTDLLTSSGSYGLLEGASDLLRASTVERVPTWLGARLEALTEECVGELPSLDSGEFLQLPAGE